MSEVKFDEALEGVFEHRARDFSPQLRELLEELWLEGVREGRTRGRLETHRLERTLETLSSSQADSRPGLERPGVVVSSQASSNGRTLEPGELTLEQITRAVAELSRSSNVRELEPSFGLRGLEQRIRLENDALEKLQLTARYSSSLASGSWPPGIEIMGTWTDEE
jgi:hypothetical protein